jgi:hypothetical protein
MVWGGGFFGALGGIRPMELCGRKVLYSLRQCSMSNAASARELNQCWLRQSSRKEAFDECVLGWFAGLDVMQAHAVALRPLMQRAPRELWAVVGDQQLGLAALGQQHIERLDYAQTADAMWSTTMARLWRVNSSTIVRQRKRRPSLSWSWMKSMLQR